MAGERIGNALDKIPEGPLGYLGEGDGIGMVGAVIRTGLESYLPEMRTDVEIANTETVPEGTKYIVNVTGAFRNVSELRAKLEPVPSIINVKEAEITDIEALQDRAVFKTYQITVLVRK